MRRGAMLARFAALAGTTSRAEVLERWALVDLLVLVGVLPDIDED
jgi:hypothetical protein